ncbi:SAV_2336 N-terminal domain-related protein [Kitasatospora sp. NPDC056273]|uniref:SAV_2336 N-terminal domain-related protein n=1 Tax=Kitasatospora sp. NPDC056273 TaxID=3345769 RepID=UPI0035DC43BD
MELSEEELLDALWLAGMLPQGVGPLARRGVPGEPRPRSDHRPEYPAAVPQDAAEPVGRPEEQETAEHGSFERPLQAGSRTDDEQLPKAGADGARAHGVRVPDNPQLPASALRLGKALRPLRQRFVDRRIQEFDLARTVAAMADSGLPETITRPARTRWLSLALVVDDGVSMVLWQGLAAKVRRLMERAGAFRDVRVYGLDARSAEAPLISARPYCTEGPFRSPASLVDPSGDTLVLIISDGVGEAWWDGRMRDAIDLWARRGPTAIVHALPTRLWVNSGIPVRRWRVSTIRRGGPNAAWQVADPVLPPGLVRFDALPVPVLEPSPAAVADWARLIASPGASALLPLWNGHRPGPGGDFADTRQEDEAEAVLRFRSAASPEAYRLAAHLAAVAPVKVPVMRLVQGALGPPTDSGHVVEVFLGGLMRQVPDGQPGLLPQHRLYDFAPETSRILLGALAPKELLRTTSAVAELLEAGVGRSPGFAAWVGHPDGTAALGDEHRPFGWLTGRLLARLGVSPGGTGEAVRGETGATGVREAELGRSADGPGAEPPQIPRGWSPLSLFDPQSLGPYTLYARYDHGWIDMPMYLALDENGETVSLRTPTSLGDLDPEQARDLIRTEAECLDRMQGVFAPKLLDARYDQEQEPPWVAASCVWRNGHSRSGLAPNIRAIAGKAWRPVDIGLFYRIGYDLACAVRHAHGRGLIHGSLTPETVLVTDRDVQLVGWMTATLDGVHSRHREDYPRDYAYRQVEFELSGLTAEDEPQGPTTAEDMFAVGAILIAAATGRWNYVGQVPDVRASLEAVGLESWITGVLWACLDRDPAKRPTAAGLADFFEQKLVDTGESLQEEAGADVAAAREAVSHYRSLWDRAPEAFSPGLASALTGLSNLLGRAGQREEAWANAAEAAQLYRALADQQPDVFGAKFAKTKNNLSVWLGELDRPAEALTLVEEAADLYRALYREGASVPVQAGLALTLNNLSNRWAGAGQDEEALAAIEEAVHLYRELADYDAGAFGPGLAQALNNLSNRLGQAGRDEEALAAIEEAVDLHGAAIDASLDDVASCLSNLAVRLGNLNRWNVAETALAESTKIRLKLNLTNPEVHEADLAQSRAIAAWLEDRRAARGT